MKTHHDAAVAARRKAERAPLRPGLMEGLMTFFLLLMLSAFPMIIGERRYFSVTADRFKTYRIIFEVSVLAMLFGALIVRYLSELPDARERVTDRRMLTLLGAMISGAAILQIDINGDGNSKILWIMIFTALQIVLFGMELYLGYDRGAKRQPALFYMKAALVLYAAWLFVTSLTAVDPATAVYGIVPRNNGLITQMSYISLFMVVTSFNLEHDKAAGIAVGGGTAFSLVCLLHFFGVDVLSVGEIVGEQYALTFYNHETKFLGTMGNVNLGSYFITVVCLLTAALFVSGARVNAGAAAVSFGIGGLIIAAVSIGHYPAVLTILLILLFIAVVAVGRGYLWEREMDIRLLPLPFAIMLFTELNMNTDAGYVALLVGGAAMAVLYCATAGGAYRLLGIALTSVAAVAADVFIIKVLLLKESHNAVFLLIIAACAVLYGLAVLVKKLHTIGRFPQPKTMRIIVLSVGAAAAAVVIAAALNVSRPVETVSGPAAAVLQQTTDYDMWRKSVSALGQLGQVLRGNIYGSLGNNRFFTWNLVLKVSKENPVFGIGADNLKRVFAARFSSEMHATFGGSGLDKAHNELLDILLASGWPGLLLDLLFYGLLFFNTFKVSEKRPADTAFGIAAFAYFIHALFGYQLPLHSPIMWTVVAIAAAGIERNNENVQL